RAHNMFASLKEGWASESVASGAPTEINLRSHRNGSIRASSSKSSLTEVSSLSDLIAFEQIHVEGNDPVMKKQLRELEVDLRRSRPGFLAILKGIGLNKLSDRQRVANTLSSLLKERSEVLSTRDEGHALSSAGGRNLLTTQSLHAELHAPAVAPRGSSTVVTPGDEHLWFTPFNWLVSPSVLEGSEGAVCVCPGAYMRIDWVGPYAAPLAIVVDTSACSDAFMTIACARNDGPVKTIELPYGDSHARLELPLLDGCGPPETSSDGERHRLWLSLHSSKQKLDRWGEPGTLPLCSLRIRKVLLPPGSTPVSPRLRPRSILVFGDSIVEGVGAEYTPGRLSDMHNNSSHQTWVKHAAQRLDAEYSCVGYGRQGWTTPGNGNVPPFASITGSSDCSWQKLWADAPRELAASGGPHVDAVLLQHGTCDGLVAGPSSTHNVRLAVAAFLPQLRAAVGPTTKIFLCVPFGGFGDYHAPAEALYAGFRQRSKGGLSKVLGMFNDVDPFTYFVQFTKDVSINLDGYKLDSSGMVKSSRESYDGVHPLAVRHAELGEVMVERLHALLEGASIESEPMNLSKPTDPANAGLDHSDEAVDPTKEKEKEEQELPLHSLLKNAVGELFKRATMSVTDPDRRRTHLLDTCGIRAPIKPIMPRVIENGMLTSLDTMSLHCISFTWRCTLV
ncbi:MAG: hypothetical protein SGPRY_011928, partial [Prymnesium sp.]